MSQVLHLGEILAMNAQLFPDKPGRPPATGPTRRPP